MPNIIQLTNLEDPRLQVFASLTEAQIRNRSHEENGLFIAESPKVIRVALQAGYQPLSLLCEQRHIIGDAADIIAQCGNIPIYTGSRQLLAQLTGYTLTRGVLCAMHRKPHPSLQTICKQASRIAVLDNIVDSTNIGAIFRSAAALGIHALLLSPSSCDPLNRRALRVSMGSVLLIPWTWIDQPINQLHQLQFKTVAMALTHNSIPLDSPALAAEPRLAIILGNEGNGLPPQTIAAADYTVRIPMSHHVDSLNVAAAAAIAFWQLREKQH